MAIYSCGRCHFVFERAGEISSCPDCGFANIADANSKEKAAYKKNQTEFNQECSKANQQGTSHT